MSKVGGQAAGQFGVRAVPTLIVVDGKGQVVLIQAGRIKADEVEARVNELLDNRGSFD
jgi:thioredoxin-like negative regulator of GroEL